MGNTQYGEENSRIVCRFFSQSPTKHQLVLDIKEIQSFKNQFMSHDPSALYLWRDEVMELKKAISDSALQHYRKEYKEKKNIEDEFK